MKISVGRTSLFLESENRLDSELIDQWEKLNICKTSAGIQCDKHGGFPGRSFHISFSQEKQDWRDIEIERLRGLIKEMTLGNFGHYHEIHCNADRSKPMGCQGCSCQIVRDIRHQKDLQFDMYRNQIIDVLNNIEQF